MAGIPKVIVAGAGPVGLLTALALAKQDVSVLVLEAEPGLTVDLRAGTCHPPSYEMMAPYGITDEMHSTAIRVPRWQIRDAAISTNYGRPPRRWRARATSCSSPA
ncbi:MAG: FAD-dependent monooxygenase [Betaproteobacteria bacterium]|nr:FAD-dependent monooxygenase [Betaproteobacteria bacterium]